MANNQRTESMIAPLVRISGRARKQPTNTLQPREFELRRVYCAGYLVDSHQDFETPSNGIWKLSGPGRRLAALNPERRFFIMSNYNKADVIAHVAENASISKTQAEAALNTFFGLVTNEAKTGGKISWAGFGSFQPSQRAARQGRNPHTGEPIQIPASTAMKFTAAKALKEALNS
jgi:DNA-binding protein HU-beta